MEVLPVWFCGLLVCVFVSFQIYLLHSLRNNACLLSQYLIHKVFKILLSRSPVISSNDRANIGIALSVFSELLRVEEFLALSPLKVCYFLNLNIYILNLSLSIWGYWMFPPGRIFLSYWSYYTGNLNTECQKTFIVLFLEFQSSYVFFKLPKISPGALLIQFHRYWFPQISQIFFVSGAQHPVL